MEVRLKVGALHLSIVKRACPCYYTRGHANKIIVDKWRSDRDQFLFTVEHAIGGVWPSAGQTESVWFYR